MRNGPSPLSPDSLTGSSYFTYEDLHLLPADEDYALQSLHNSAEAASSYDGIIDPDEARQLDEEEGKLLNAPGQLSQGSSVLGRPFQATLTRWIRGPDPLRAYRIQSSEWLQVACNRLLDRCFPSKWLKVSVLLLLYCLWTGVFVFASPLSLDSNGSGSARPVRLSCTSQLWSNSTNCGLDGQECRGIDNSSLAFVCPAGCSEVQILEPHFVGAQPYNYQSFVIGGPRNAADPSTAIYRGDSFICPAGIHAGIVSNSKGGCGRLIRTGQQSDYPRVDAHGIISIAFPSNFPLSFNFDTSSSAISSCDDSRWTLLGFSMLFTGLLAIFVTSPAIFFWSIFVGVFFHSALISDPPFFQEYTDMLSMAFRRFLPAAFVAQVVYKYCIHRTLHELKAPMERTILWLGGCWIGALNNVTFDRLPISRLTPHDLEQQPGAIVALISIISIILLIAIGQAWCFRIEGRMPRYLAFYGIVTAVLICFVLVPGMNLRIHHYILGLIFLPGTSLQTRPSLLYQGILLGLFINGIARWGFDSVLQTPGALLQDGQLGSLLPQVSVPVISGNDITFAFEVAPSFDGISALVNDVQRFLAFSPDTTTFKWTRLIEHEPEFFRFGYAQRLQFGGEWYGDFTAPGQWLTNGTWIPGSS